MRSAANPNAMVDKAEKVAAGTRPLRMERFVAVRGADKAVAWARVERARQLAGLKGYQHPGHHDGRDAVISE